MNAFAPERIVLDNGLTLVHQHNPASPAVVVSLGVAAGAVGESAPQAGLAGFTATMLRRGTGHRSKNDIGEVLDFRGAHLQGSGARHRASLVAKMRAVDVPELLELMSDCCRNPTFPAAELEQVRGNRLTSLREDDDDPEVRAARAFREMIYPEGHPYRQSVRGTPASITALRADDLREFHQRCYVPDRALLVIVGAVEAPRVVELTNRHFGDWTGAGGSGYRHSHPEVPDAELHASAEYRVDMPDKAQASVLVGHRGIRRADPRFFAAVLMNSVLGQFAMGGRLGRVVREERGMAYHTSSSLGAGIGAGAFTVRAGVQPQHIGAAVEVIREELARMRDGGISEAELDDSCSAAVRSLPRALESNEGLAGLIHQIELFGLGWDYPDRYPDLLRSVTVEQVAAAARELLHPEMLQVAMAGPVGAPPGQ